MEVLAVALFGLCAGVLGTPLLAVVWLLLAEEMRAPRLACGVLGGMFAYVLLFVAGLARGMIR